MREIGLKETYFVRSFESFDQVRVTLTMEQLLAGKTALITGGGIGIGAGIAASYVTAGALVAITYRSHPPSDELLAHLTGTSGRPPLVLQVDATSEESVMAAAERISENLGKLDILVNNVGGLVKRAQISEMPFAVWKEVMAVNLDSAFLFTHYLLPVLSSGSGRIINIASLAGRNGGHPGATAYAAAKAALFGFTRGLAKELASAGITVNAVAPGFIEGTPFHERFTTEESKKTTISAIPVGRAGTPSDVASAALWLASASASFVTGTIIDVNGGQYFG
ncbi:MAG TPA: SDR family oxidoreductase [Steroidobacteraceae bacterium]|jgi:3-oxoacyl-[acyl-carrier protein] reductase